MVEAYTFYNIGGSGGTYLVASTDGQTATFMTYGVGSTWEPNGAENVRPDLNS